jgi:outer membrane protein TolC
VQIALLESPTYQQQLENLYLSGLDVTFERFRFDTQFFGGSGVFFTSEGEAASGLRNAAGDPVSSSLLQVQPSRTTGVRGAGNRFRAEKLTTTGGELVVGLANSLVWQFAGPDDYSSRTLLDFSLVQPLLRFGGRVKVMERLTIAERALLANVRQMEHYRRGFYLSVVTGEDPGQGPNRRGGFFGGAGLEGFSGVGGGGFGRVGEFGGGGLGQGFGFTGGAGAQQAGGYIGLLQSAQIIQNQYSNIAGLTDSVEQLQAAHDAGRIDKFQVDLARQALYNAQSQLLNSETTYDDTLDNFKLQHGLPPNLPLKISDPLLDNFELLDEETTAVHSQVTAVLTAVREIVEDQPIQNEPVERLVLPPIPSKIGEQDLPRDLPTLVAEAATLIDSTKARYVAAERDLQQLAQALPARRAALERLAERDEVRKAEMEAHLFSVSILDNRYETLKKDVAALGGRMEKIWDRLKELTGDMSLTPAEQRAQLASALTQLSGEMLELSLLQAQARLDAITFDPVDLSPENAFCIASRYRRDWMNARAALVDSWRLIAFNANDLQSDLDVVFSGDIGNVGDNPFRLRGTNGRLRVGLEFDAPLTRLAERNVYRQSLIEYQQARRNYYRFRDNVHRRIRNTIRQLRVDELNFELRRAAVHTAISQVDLARLRLSEPARPVAASAPGQPTQPGGESQFGDTVARDLVNALIDLLNVQNDFLSVWVDHEVQRLNLDFDLGIMELDANGLRIEHDQPLKTFLVNLPAAAPCECPDACAGEAPLPGDVIYEDLPPGTTPATAPKAAAKVPQEMGPAIEFAPEGGQLGPALLLPPSPGAKLPAGNLPASEIKQ